MLLGGDFSDGIAVQLASIAEGGGAVRLGEAQEQIWYALSARYYVDEATTDRPDGPASLRTAEVVGRPGGQSY